MRWNCKRELLIMWLIKKRSEKWFFSLLIKQTKFILYFLHYLVTIIIFFVYPQSKISLKFRLHLKEEKKTLFFLFHSFLRDYFFNIFRLYREITGHSVEWRKRRERSNSFRSAKSSKGTETRKTIKLNLGIEFITRLSRRREKDWNVDNFQKIRFTRRAH